MSTPIMEHIRLPVLIQILGAVIIMFRVDWNAPDWRPEFTNALIGWVFVGILSCVASIIRWPTL